jgi:uncharacterized protein YcbK (DUF882 family)
MKYFSYKEFDSPDMPGSGNLMDENFLQMLDEVRDKFGKPIVINSGYRSEEHNAAVGGKPKTETSRGSSHMYGLAADIKCDNSVDRFHLIFLLQETGFQRIGVAKTFIHVDLDFEKSQQVMWMY